MKYALAAILLMLTLSAAACLPAIPTAVRQPVTSTSTPLAPHTPTEYIPSPLPITPTYEGCAYVWASQDMPELSRKLNAQLQEISMNISGLAYAYGEDCVYADGHSTFSALETDFRVGVKVRAVSDKEALGNWIRKVMDVIVEIPPEELMGPRAGRVDFDFKQPDPAELIVTVPIDQYRREADNLKGAALLRLFENTP